MTPENQEPSPQQTTVSMPSPPEKHSKMTRKKWLLVAGLAFGCVLIVGAVSYLLFKKDTSAPQAKNDMLNDTVADKAVFENATNNLFFQAGSKIIAYDTTNKTPVTVSDALPEDSSILDFYAGAEGWRAFYLETIKSGDNEPSILSLKFVENGEPAKELASQTAFFWPKANAREKVVAYSTTPQIYNEDTGDNTTKTYYSKDLAEPQLVYESDRYNFDAQKVPPYSVRDPHFVLSDLSPDGNQALFARYRCFDCDAFPGGSYVEFDFTSSAMRPVDLGGASETSELQYDKTQKARFLLNEFVNPSYQGGIGDYSGFGMKLSRFDSPAQKALIFEEENDNWQLDPPVSPDLSMIAYGVYDNPGEWTPAHIEGVYVLGGTSIASATRLPVDGLVGTSVYGVSNIKNGCLGLQTLTSNDPNLPTQNIGVACKVGETYKYTLLAELEHQNYSPVSQILF